MERRSHRAIVLAIVIVLHLPLLVFIRSALMPAEPKPTQRGLVVEFLLTTAEDALRDEPAVPDPGLRVTRGRSEHRPQHALRAVETASMVRAMPESPSTPEFSLIGDDGRLRVSRELAADLDAIEAARAAAAQAPTYRIPLGDQSILAARRSPIDVGETRFSRAWKPTDMNPVEEACWKNKALAFVLSALGSQDCAQPGVTRRPLPAMIYYGRDDAEEILRKTEEWERYDRR